MKKYKPVTNRFYLSAMFIAIGIYTIFNRRMALKMVVAYYLHKNTEVSDKIDKLHR